MNALIFGDASAFDQAPNATPMRAVWNDSGLCDPTYTNPGGSENWGGCGLNQLFAKHWLGTSKGCLNCHLYNSASSTGWDKRFNHCANCHDPSVSPSVYPTSAFPDWLQFDSKAKVMRNSYSLPGFTKAQASVKRARDGSMPPGAWHSDMNLHTGEPVSWCDEIQALLDAWIAAGYP